MLGFDLKDRGLKVWSAQDMRVLVTAETPVRAAINNTGEWVLYTAPGIPSGTHLRSLALRSGRDVMLAYLPESYVYSAPVPTISNDGTAVLYLAARRPGERSQIWPARPGGAGRKQSASLPEGVKEAVLAGSGRYAIAATSAGRVLRTGTADGAIEKLIAKTPVAYGPGSVAPGSAHQTLG